MPRKPTKKETEGEVAEQPDKIKIAVMNNDIKHINDTLVRIEGKFDAAITSFVTVDQLASAQLRADEKHAEQDKAIKSLQDWNTWAQRIVLGTVLLSVLGTVLITK